MGLATYIRLLDPGVALIIGSAIGYQPKYIGIGYQQ